MTSDLDSDQTGQSPPAQPTVPDDLDHTTADQPQPRRTHRWPWLAATAATGLVGLAVGVAIGASTIEPEVRTITVTEDPTEEREAELQERALDLDGWQNDLTEQEIELEDREADLDAREEAIGVAEEEAAASTITDGIWTVGVDIEPGTYRATDVSADCYWAILVTGSNGEDIVNNDLPGGGNPTVTLQEGWDFETSECGEWRRQ